MLKLFCITKIQFEESVLKTDLRELPGYSKRVVAAEEADKMIQARKMTGEALSPEDEEAIHADCINQYGL